jgi:hypothetical protein
VPSILPRPLAAALLASALLSANAAAQDSARVAAPRDTVVADTSGGLPEIANRMKPPASPTGAAVRSLILPGWGQYTLHKPIMAGAFLASELVWAGLAIKEHREISNLRTLRLTDTTITDAQITVHTQKREDWLFILALNHMISGIEAYVTGHFWDFPKNLSIQARRGGGMTATLSLPIQIR